LGVLAEPKDAKAPEPRPKALEAPPVGDIKPVPGVVAKELDLPWEEVSPPWRLAKDALRLESPVKGPFAGLPGVDRESLPVLGVLPC
jgi:hypothetical protein